MKNRVLSIWNNLRLLFTPQVSAYSGQVTLFFIISAFPLTMMLISLIGVIPGLDRASLEQMIHPILPELFFPAANRILNEVYGNSGIGVLSLSAVTTLWAASKGFNALIRGLNEIYEREESRNYFIIRGMAILYTLVMAAAILLTLGLLVFGNMIADAITRRIPELARAAFLITTYRWLVVFVLLFLLFLCCYRFAPCRNTGIKNHLPGALISAAGWLGFSYIYAIYLNHVQTYLYGSLTALVFLMLWLYACIYILFIGGRINRALYDRRNNMQS